MFFSNSIDVVPKVSGRFRFVKEIGIYDVYFDIHLFRIVVTSISLEDR